MTSPKRGQGRPAVYTDAERKAARRKTKQESYRRRRDYQKDTQQQQEHQQRDNTTVAALDLQIQFDPLCSLRQPGPGENGQGTVRDYGIQAEGLNAAADELSTLANKGQEQQLLQEQQQLQERNLPPRIEDDSTDEPPLPDIASLCVDAEAPTPQSPPRQPTYAQSRSRPQLATARTTPPIPHVTSIRAEEDDEGADRDGEAPRQLGERVQLTASVEPSSPIHESPLPREESVESFPLLGEEGNAEDGDWIEEVDAASSDSASDDEAEEEIDNNPVESDAGSREAKERERMDAAIAALKRAWAAHCTCEEPAHCVDETGHSLAEMTGFWQRQVSPFAPPGIANFPLDMPKICSREDDSDNFRNVPWRSLLAGGEGDPPKLSIRQSEIRFQGTDRDIDRRWDVDSFIARVTTLAVHRGGFDLAYRPPYLRRITQNQRIRINGHPIHKLKQLRLGVGLAAAGFRYECHVFFPNMEVKARGETHLSDKAQAIWIDGIVLPALKRSCRQRRDVFHHHPHSFADAKSKAEVKRELFTSGTSHAMDIKYTVPEDCLDPFWKEVLRLSQEHSGDGNVVPHNAFRDPFLVVSGHGLKLSTKRDTFELARMDFLAHLEQCFDVSPERMPPEDCWLDLGMEDTPLAGSAPCEGITLLRKRYCLDWWIEQFSCPESESQLIKPSHFHWALTRDAGDASVELRQTNALRKGGIAYNKAYNVNKELFATPLKGYSPFQNPQFEALGYSQELLNRWYSLNSIHTTPQQAKKRQQLLNAYRATKNRLSGVLTQSSNEDYGVRQEYRINIGLFRRIEDVGANEENEIEQQQHRPYWILPTREVNAFAAANISRWLLLLEVLIGRVDAGHDGRLAATREQQLMNGVMVSAVIQALQLIASTDPAMCPKIWKSQWYAREWKRVGRGEDGADDSDSNGDGGGGNRSSRRRLIGLNFRGSIEESGMAWLPQDLIHWNVTPTFTEQALKRLALAENAFRKSFQKTWGIQKLLSREDTMLNLFRSYLRESEMDGIRVGAQLVIRSYIQEVIALLAGRWTDGPRNPRKRLEEFIARAGLEDEEASGLQGLSWAMVSKLIGGPPRIVGVRPSKAGGKARNGKAHFAKYDTGLWRDKVFALFAWDDERADARKKRGWHNAAFRLLTRRLHSIVVEEVGVSGGRMFLDFVKVYAAHFLWAIPQYDYDKLSVMYKASKHHSQTAQAEISVLTPLERTNWLVPQVSVKYESDLYVIQKHYSQDRRGLDRTACKEARKNIKRGLDGLKLAVHSSDDSGVCIPKDHRYFGIQMELTWAKEFMDVLDGLIADQEAESEENLM